MDNHENLVSHNDAADLSAAYETDQAPVSGAQKRSPFADSPFVMEHAPETECRQGKTLPPEEKKRSGGRVWKCLLAAVLILALTAGGCGITAWSVHAYWEERADDLADAFSDKLEDLQDQIDELEKNGIINGGSVSGSPAPSGDGLSPSQIYAKNENAVVAISNQTTTTNVFGEVSETASTGSGFIISEDGYVVTNHHVVEGATKLKVITSDGDEYEAKLIGANATNDVALLKIEAQGLTSVTIGSSDDLIVGDQVVAIGNPLGELTNTLTVGYVSAKERDVSTGGAAINMLQIDAAINSGNSGGPLFNMKGEVIGINTAKYSGTTSSGATIEGIGFAIPIDDVIELINDLKEHGYVTGAYLGVTVQEMDAQSADLYNLPMGAYVREINRGFCAEVAGMKEKDIIVALGGYEVEGLNDLSRALRKFKAGDTTTVTVYRAGRNIELTITLDERPANLDTTVDSTVPDDSNLPKNGSFEDWYDFFFGNQN